MSAQTESIPTPPAPRPRRTLWRRVILFTLLLFVGAASVMVFLARAEPAHWKKHRAFMQTHSTQAIAALAKGVEDKLRALFDGPGGHTRLGPNGEMIAEA